MTTQFTLKNARRAILIAGACTVPALFIGCGTSSHAGDEMAIRANPTPALSTLTLRRQDEYNRSAYVNDTNLRLLREDLARVMYLDRPSRLYFGPKP